MTADVLIVDDSLTVRADLQEAFEHEALTVATAASVAEAMAALESGAFGLVVLDVVLPDGDGLEVLRRLKEDPRTGGLPVMLLSTEAEVGARIRGLRIGADEYAGKPYDRGYVIDRARQLIASTHGAVARAARPTVLLVESSRTYGAAFASALEAEGYAVVVGEPGQDAVRRAASLRPQVLIVDRRFGDRDGATIIQQIRLDPALRRIACFLVLDSDEPGAELEALAAGADGSIRRDEDFGLVLARLRAVTRAGAGELPTTAGVIGPKKVLVVQGNAAERMRLASDLRHDGYDIAVAPTAREALDLLAVQTMDGLVVDLDLPDWSGVDLLKALRSVTRWRGIAAIVHADAASEGSIAEAIEAGADDYVSKSSDVQLLRARLRAVLRRNQIEEEDRRYLETLVRKDAEAAEARLRAELAETRASLLEDLERKNAELEEANRQLGLAKEHAEQESQFKSRFLAIMSHELRTPLNAILGFGQLLERGVSGPLNERQLREVLSICRNARQLGNLVNDMLDLSKIQAGKMTLTHEPLDVRTECQTAMDTVSALAAEREVGLCLGAAETLPHVYADPFRLQQILGNLLTNAIKFTPSGGRVTLRGRAAAGGVEIAVEDTGIGIAAEDFPRLFREFERLESGRAHRAEGTGLGLALTKHLVQLHEGRIEVRSEPDVGSVFTVWLPGAPPPAPHTSA